MPSYYLFRATPDGKCIDCGLFDGHSNACHDEAPKRMIDELTSKLESSQRETEALKDHLAQADRRLESFAERWKHAELQVGEAKRLLTDIRIAMKDGALVESDGGHAGDWISGINEILDDPRPSGKRVESRCPLIEFGGRDRCIHPVNHTCAHEYGPLKR